MKCCRFASSPAFPCRALREIRRCCLRLVNASLDAVLLFLRDLGAHKRTEEKPQGPGPTMEESHGRIMRSEARVQQLQRVVLHGILAEEQEKRHIGKILDSEVQQILASVKMRLYVLGRHVGNRQARGTLKDIAALVDKSLAVCSLLYQDLSLPVLKYTGLAGAMKELAGSMQKEHDLSVKLIIKDECDERPCALPFELFAYRAVQEMLLNVVKHAGVLEAIVRLDQQPGRFRVEVADAGRGFDPGILGALPGQAEGYGLVVILERAASLGGTLTIDSALGRGTRLALTAPLPDSGFAV